MSNNTIIRVILLGSLLIMAVGCSKSPKPEAGEPAANKMQMEQAQPAQPVEPTQPAPATAPAMEYGAPTAAAK